MLLVLIFVSCAGATAQTTPTSTPTSPSALTKAQREVGKEAAGVNRETDALRLELQMQRLLGEVRAARGLISTQSNELIAAQAQIDAEKQNSASFEKSNVLAEREIQHLSQAIESKSETINVLKERNEQLKRSASKNRKRALWATAAAAALAGVLLIK
jgi:predicted  nucleic acid-binding Zn-ribbon protein